MPNLCIILVQLIEGANLEEQNDISVLLFDVPILLLRICTDMRMCKMTNVLRKIWVLLSTDSLYVQTRLPLQLEEAYLTASEKRQLAPLQFLGHIAAQHMHFSKLTHKGRAVDCCRANTYLVLRPPSLSIFYKFVLQPVEPALNLSEARDAVSAALN